MALGQPPDLGEAGRQTTRRGCRLGARRRILVLNERDLENPLAGGAEVHVFEIFQRLVERGHTVQLFAASFRGAAAAVSMRGIAVRRLANRYLYYARVPMALRRELAAGSIEVVVDVLNKFPFFTPWVADVPCCAVVHHLFGRTAFRQVRLPVALATYLAEKLIPLAHRRTPMLAISESTRDDLLARGIAADNVTVAPPGLDGEVYAPTHQPIPTPLIVWIGRLEHYKRADVMIDALPEICRRVPETRLAIIGSGHARGALEEHARRRGVADAIEFTGFISEQRKVAYLQRAALLVNTSEKEGFGLTVVEANACGTPSIATDVPGLRDSVRHGETGFLVPFGDASALAQAAVRLLTDEPLRARLAANGLVWASRFSWERAADATEAIIEHAIATHTRARAERAAASFSERGNVEAR